MTTNYGRVLARRTTVDPRRKKIVATNLKTGEQLTFLGLPECEDAGFTAANVSRCCTGHRNKHGGYTWKYVD